MGTRSSGRLDQRAAPYFRQYVSLSADVDLTEEVTNAKCATSGLVVINGTGGAANLVIEDASGEELTIALSTSDQYLYLPLAAVRLDQATTDGVVVIAYWHPIAPR